MPSSTASTGPVSGTMRGPVLPSRNRSTRDVRSTSSHRRDRISPIRQPVSISRRNAATAHACVAPLASNVRNTAPRRGNPYDNAMMESFMKTLKVEGVYPMAFESEEDVAGHLPRFIDSYNERRLHSALGYLSPNRFEEEQPRKPVKSAA